MAFRSFFQLYLFYLFYQSSCVFSSSRASGRRASLPSSTTSVGSLPAMDCSSSIHAFGEEMLGTYLFIVTSFIPPSGPILDSISQGPLHVHTMREQVHLDNLKAGTFDKGL
ncbi:hypothetical protein FRB91_000742 [Serendipita sp. 411]|nr:hypothetical protein FRB91_000742 [Serendipita sp. 411]